MWSIRTYGCREQPACDLARSASEHFRHRERHEGSTLEHVEYRSIWRVLGTAHINRLEQRTVVTDCRGADHPFDAD